MSHALILQQLDLNLSICLVFERDFHHDAELNKQMLHIVRAIDSGI